jgi:hypothetical protein
MMQRTKLRKQVGISTASTTSDPVTLNAFVWFTVEVADADKEKTITIQTQSGITGAWEDVVSLTDVTSKYKGLTPQEMATVGCLDQIRIKYSAAPAANGFLVLHLSS